jgi:4-amino-4-deoxy-L-arabinose transferase-like glycosyltransferase
LLAFILVGIAMALSKLKKPSRQLQNCTVRMFLFWTVWFFTFVIYFNLAEFFHRYYLVMIAPAFAALAGMSLVEMWKSYGAKGWRGWILPVAIMVTAGVQMIFLGRYIGWSSQITFIMLLLCFISASSLIWFRIKKFGGINFAKTAILIGLLGLLTAPVAWSVTPIVYGDEPNLPYAGPELSKSYPEKDTSVIANLRNIGENKKISKLISFLKENRGNEKYLVAVPNATLASPIILATGEPVMAVGGFLGIDQTITVDQLKNAKDYHQVLEWRKKSMNGSSNGTLVPDDP